MISSTSNPTIKQIRKLSDRKERQQSGLFYIEGLRIVGEAIQSRWEIDALVIAPELLTSLFGKQISDEYKYSGGEIIEVSSEVFKSISQKEGPQGIGAVVHQKWTSLDDVQPVAEDLWVALDQVQDPGNLGTILRTCDAVGACGVILLDHSTDVYDLSSVRASMGAIFSQKLVRASLSDFVSWKKSQSIFLVGTSDKAKVDYHQHTYETPLVILMGSERQGLQETHLSICDSVVRIPMLGRSDSLNLSIATAVLLYEIFNQRRDHLEVNQGIIKSRKGF